MFTLQLLRWIYIFLWEWGKVCGGWAKQSPLSFLQIDPEATKHLQVSLDKKAISWQLWHLRLVQVVRRCPSRINTAYKAQKAQPSNGHRCFVRPMSGNLAAILFFFFGTLCCWTRALRARKCKSRCWQIHLCCFQTGFTFLNRAVRSKLLWQYIQK